MRRTNHFLALYFENQSYFNYTFLFSGSDEQLPLILTFPPPIHLAQSKFHILYIYIMTLLESV
jgi:hypothetical protein